MASVQNSVPATHGKPAVRAVIVDDEPDMRLLLRMSLTLAGECEVVGEAVDGNDGFQVWEATRPDVLVLDMRMPGESGLDLARRVLADVPDTQIIMCSAYMSDIDRARAHEIGVAACLDKSEIASLAQLVLAVAATHRPDCDPGG